MSPTELTARRSSADGENKPVIRREVALCNPAIWPNIEPSGPLAAAFVDGPSSMNRLIGMTQMLFPDAIPDDMNAEVRDFYSPFRQVNRQDTQIGPLIVAMAGVIDWTKLMVPHMARLFVGQVSTGPCPSRHCWGPASW